MPTPTITAQDFITNLQGDGTARTVDVRTPAEFRSEHIDGSVLIPLADLPSRLAEIRELPGPPILLCRSGQRAVKAHEVLARSGVQDAVIVEGGIAAYLEAGGATRRGKATMSLERQVRLTAGALVLSGVVLGFLIHPAAHVLAGGVGLGLIVAALTDTCAMGLLLARMPWNQQ